MAALVEALDRFGVAEHHHRAVVHGVCRCQARQDEAVNLNKGDADIAAGGDGLQHPASRGAVPVDVVSTAPDHRWCRVGLVADRIGDRSIQRAIDCGVDVVFAVAAPVSEQLHPGALGDFKFLGHTPFPFVESERNFLICVARHGASEPAGLNTDNGAGSRLGAGGTRPSTSVKPYSPASSEASRICPVFSITRGSLARAATARPTNTGVSPRSAINLASAGGTRSGCAASFSLLI